VASSVSDSLAGAQDRFTRSTNRDRKEGDTILVQIGDDQIRRASVRSVRDAIINRELPRLSAAGA